MTDDTRTLDDEAREDLVAYLDGELDESQTREVERTLASSPEVREEVQRLQRSFDLLDLLPLARASGEFTERTLSTIRSMAGEETVAERSLADWSPVVRRGAVISGWVVGLALTAVLGYVATHDWLETDADELVRDLPVIEKLNVYADAGSLEFVERLHKSRLVDEFATNEPGRTAASEQPGPRPVESNMKDNR